MSKTYAAAVLIGALTASTAVFAGSISFQKADADQDGFLSFEEISVLMPDMSEEVFKTADVNQDSLLDPAEFEAVLP